MIRKSHIEIHKIYFWTCTIYQWKSLLEKDKYKELVKLCLEELVEKKLATIYAYVIMPNHIHLIIQFNKLNGKEMPNATLLKDTAHRLVKDLKSNALEELKKFEVQEKDRKYRIWQRDSLAVEILSKEMMEQKLGYIHHNPVQERWNLVKDTSDYQYSSCAFYQKGNTDKAEFLTDYSAVF